MCDVSSTVGLTRCYKTEGFYAFIKVYDDAFSNCTTHILFCTKFVGSVIDYSDFLATFPYLRHFKDVTE